MDGGGFGKRGDNNYSIDEINLLEDIKEDQDDENYQKAVREAWEKHDSQIESLQ